MANIFLLLSTLNEIYAHYALDEGLEKMSPAIVFSLLLTCRLIIFLQSLAAEPKSVFEKSQLDTNVVPPADRGDLRADDKKEQ